MILPVPRTTLLWLGLVLFGCKTIRDQEVDVCGNGLVEGGEECDGTLLNPPTCESINPLFPKGKVRCKTDCRYDLTGCTLAQCGDGLVHMGESCDGTNFQGLTCKSVGLYNTGELLCTEQCTLDTSQCAYTCRVQENFALCDPLGGLAECCPHNGHHSHCSASFGDGTARCLQTCDNKSQCGYNLVCRQYDQVCTHRYCGPGTQAGGELNAQCALDNTTLGWCLPVGLAQDNIGLCVEGGSVPHGSSCTRPISLTGSLSYDATALCSFGECVGKLLQGVCAAYCDPMAAYETGEDSCPATFNCLNLSTLEKEQADPLGIRNEAFLFRTPPKGLCYPTQADSESALEPLLTCDLLTGLQIREGDTPCPQGTSCKHHLDGSLMGVCLPHALSPLPQNDSCTPTTGPRPCDHGLDCLQKDPLNDPTPMTPLHACIKPCDASLGPLENPSCAGLTTQGGTPLICLTLSRFYTPDHDLPTLGSDGPVEAAPSPLGYCVPPQQQ